MDKKALGKRINASRKEKGWTSEQLSEACDINATYVRQIEAGAKTPSLPVFISICNQLQVSPTYLLYDSLTDINSKEMDALWELWQTATPWQLKMITSMIEGALKIYPK